MNIQARQQEVPVPGRRSSLLRHYRSLSLAYKLALAFWLVLVLGMGTLIMLVSNYQRMLLELQVQSLGQIIASQFAATVTEPLFTDDLLSMEVMAFNLVKDPRISAVMIKDENGSIVAQARADNTKPSAAVIDEPIPASRLVFTHDRSIRVASPVIFKDITAGQVVVDFVPLELNRSFNWMLQTLIGVTLFTTLLMMLTAFFMSRRISRPITTLVRATKQIGEGEYTVQLDTDQQDEFGHLASAINQMASGLEQKRIVESVLNKVVASDVADALLNRGDTPLMEGKLVDATILFVDIAGFTSLSERLPPASVVKLLNRYFDYFNTCGHLFYGHVDKFIGDCAMIVFGAPKYSAAHRIQAIACAMAIQRLLDEMRERDPENHQMHVRIGINSGEVMAGTVGAQQRMEYTVIGDTVNLASRLTALAPTDGILAGEATVNHRSVRDRVVVKKREKFKVRGKVHATSAVEISSIAPEYARVIENLIDDIVS